MCDQMREKITNFIESQKTQFFIIGLIVINAIIIGLETSSTIYDAYGKILSFIDNVILGVFILEIILRFIAYRLDFFRKPWSVFDLIVVLIAIVPTSGNLSVLRALRIIRVFRLVSSVPSMRRVVNGLLASIPGMGSVTALLLLIFYVFAVMATNLFGEKFPIWFGTIGESAYTLFQIMTLESWSMGVVRPVMDAFPQSWIFFVPFILITSFAVLNLFIGIIVDAMNHESNEQAAKEKEDLKQALKRMEERLERIEDNQKKS